MYTPEEKRLYAREYYKRRKLLIGKKVKSYKHLSDRTLTELIEIEKARKEKALNRYRARHPNFKKHKEKGAKGRMLLVKCVDCNCDVLASVKSKKRCSQCRKKSQARISSMCMKRLQQRKPYHCRFCRKELPHGIRVCEICLLLRLAKKQRIHLEKAIERKFKKEALEIKKRKTKEKWKVYKKLKTREYYRSDPKGRAKKRWYKRLRKERLRNVVHAFSMEEWISKVEATVGVCPCCSSEVGVDKLEMDHIFPVSKAEPGRIYEIGDVTPLCKACNVKKADSI